MDIQKVFRIVTAVVALSLHSLVLLAEPLGEWLGDYALVGGADQSWHLWVGRDFTINSEYTIIEGRIFVGHDLTVNGRGQFGQINNGSGVWADSSLPFLVVGGNIKGRGDLQTLGNYTIQVGGGFQSTSWWDNRKPVVTAAVDRAAIDATKVTLSAKSRYWGGLPNTTPGSVYVEWGALKLVADPQVKTPQTWVFNVTNDIVGCWGVMMENIKPQDSVLINCHKTNGNKNFEVDFNALHINGDKSVTPLQAKILWNFPEATTINFRGGMRLLGTLLVGSVDSLTTINLPAGCFGRIITCGDLTITPGLLYNYPFTGELPVPVAPKKAPKISALNRRSGKFVPTDTREGQPPTVELSFDSIPGQCYEIQHCSDLNTPCWTALELVEAITTETILDLIVPDPHLPSHFFRIVTQP